MICTKCGARLLDTDQFCPKCGTKAIKEKRCPDCGAVLREGTKFCHKCGRLVESVEDVPQVSEETLDIPIEAIERNILSETEAKIMAERNVQSTGKSNKRKVSQSEGSQHKSRPPQNAGSQHKSRTSQEGTVRRTPEPPKKKRTVPEPPSKKKKPVYREDDWEEEDWEEDDWDDDEEESVDVITVMTAVVGCVLLVVVAFLGYHLYQQYVPKDYEKVQEQQDEEQQDEENQDSGQEVTEGDDGSAVYTLTIVDNVNVRDNPSTSGTNIIKVAKEGETYECYGSAGDGSWYEIRLEDGTKGYVFKDYVTVE
ncbi:MAG: zinc-ribbon domain-containing protein [Lachnospiraceae bacterium]|nr:zinc-ribbon domain-containing protein [Lachnospiraceae bacterium]